MDKTTKSDEKKLPVCQKCKKIKYHHSTVGDVKFYRCKNCKTPLQTA